MAAAAKAAPPKAAGVPPVVPVVPAVGAGAAPGWENDYWNPVTLTNISVSDASIDINAWIEAFFDDDE